METWTSRAAGSSTCLTVSSCFPSRCLVPLLFRLSQFYLKNPLFRSSFNSCILSSQKLAAFHLGHFEVSCPCVAVHSPSSSPRTRFREASSPLTACVLQACFPTRLLCSPARQPALVTASTGLSPPVSSAQGPLSSNHVPEGASRFSAFTSPRVHQAPGGERGGVRPLGF